MTTPSESVSPLDDVGRNDAAFVERASGQDAPPLPAKGSPKSLSGRTVPGAAVRDRRPKAMLWWALGLLASFALMGVLVGTNAAAPFTQPLDDWWRALAGASSDGAMHTGAPAMFFQHLGMAWGALFTLVLIPAGLAVTGRWRSGLFFMTAGLVGPVLFSQVMKNLVNRPRPAADEALGLFGPLFQVDHGSFPSGHAVTAGALAFSVAALIPAGRRIMRRVWWIIGAAIMLGMMWQRTLINAHWLSDTFFGLVAGAAGALLMWWAFWPLLQRDYGRPVWFLHHRKPRPATEQFGNPQRRIRT